MRIDPAGLPFIAAPLVPAAAALAARRPKLALPFAALAGFMAFFFRDPERIPLRGDHLVLAPADGKVMVAGEVEPGAAPEGQWKQISIFLSPLDVHINRIPYSGRVEHVEYRPGQFLPAYEPGAAVENERSEIWIRQGERMVVARQIVGILARRVVCRAVEGTDVRAGDRYGLMKFGSRMDVFVPPEASVEVRVGDRVRGAETVLARFPVGTPR
jgi:phosphatidylserine decarboxylase